MSGQEEYDEFMGGGFKTFPFDNPGDLVSGYVIELPVKEQQKDMKTGLPKFWNDDTAQPMWMWRIVLQTELRDPKDQQDDGRRTLYLSWHRLNAVRNAVRAAGETKIKLNGQLALRFDAYGEETKKGFSKPKIDWTAWYRAPASEPEFMEGPGAAQAAPPPAAPPPPPPPPPAQPAPPVRAYDPAVATSTLDALAAQRARVHATQASALAASDAFPTSVVAAPEHHSQDSEIPF